jgi:hypothetical protein
MPLTARQAPREARMSRRRQLRKSNCQSTGGGVRAQEGPGIVTDPASPPREGEAWERVPRLAGQSPANWPLPHGGERHKGADRRSPTRDPASLQGLKSGSGRRTPRPRGGHGRGSGWCHPQEDDPLRAPHPLKDGGPGTGLDQFEGVKGSRVPGEDDLRTGRRLRIRGELRAHFS